jgi:signal transduction histidine kinase
LPIARGIVRAHGGEVDHVDGAFEIRLPGASG